MRLLSRILALALVLLAGSARFSGAQEVNLLCLGGEHLSEGDMSHGVNIVVVWASWSPRSRDIVQRVNPIAARWKGSARVSTVNFQEERKAVEGFLAGKSLGAPVCLDPDGLFSHRYNVANLPGLLVVKDGQVLFHGKLPDDPDRVIAELLH
jgi:thiol-disulfide isomerase/thioredoxin